ncbi:glycogen/starch/alpha-glucan phosphorylase [Eubacterium pyruvativorans]|uniref:glycogen/starch/alpha-glucan phosphorylase n=1 Tax=Eubacterium pyruvativorans TaxID=155865 RepID=UPI0023F28D81|nr:glycogen/starch/alpha-glucan phosphorylase [Eubacterium pyruvativorans]MCI5746835.1 glycogen/starch/alpha-glucan phosphorylase [Eubacterium pyruvativorans]
MPTKRKKSAVKKAAPKQTAAAPASPNTPQGFTLPTEAEFLEELTLHLENNYHTDFENASPRELYMATAEIVNSQLLKKKWAFNKVRREAEKKESGKKKIYYISMEFLMGQSLKNNLYNLDETGIVAGVMKRRGISMEELYDQEPDAGLGNGGLGRLAACYMDALASQEYDATGFSIRYEYGLFKQKIVDGWQVEMPDNWLPGGHVWLNRRDEDTFRVGFYGDYHEYWTEAGLQYNIENQQIVEAIPFDMCISGADSPAVDKLRLWWSTNRESFDMNSFNNGDFTRAQQETNKAELISKVLYPADNIEEGKELRLKQQYFMVSASCQNIIRDHLRLHGTLDNFPEKVAIHINDTHPALCVPELMRLFMDEHGMEWDKAWDLVTRTVTYTNHTVLAEALEKWNQQLVRMLMPRIYAIIREIDRRFREDMEKLFPGDTGKINYMAPLGEDQVRMANLSVIGSHRVNGVSALHSEILKDDLFHDFYLAWPDKFTNVTNGIAYRRWLCQSNPKLASLLDETIGPDYRKDARKLEEFAKFASDSSVRKRVEEIKRENKAAFSDRLKAETGICPDPDSLFITQAKRLHEYKRQLLNALRIISRYNMLRENPNLDMRPETYLFAAKSAPNYYLAKNIIQLICRIGEEIEKDPKIRQKMRVIFLENYSVSMAERLMPASDISEQISLAGKEASGTGNMKLMINGAITIGTLDGANVEMREAVGDDAIFIFGQKADEVQKNLAAGYRSLDIYESNPAVKAAVDRLGEGFAGTDFHKLKDYLLRPTYSIADPYMCLKDFDDYCRVHQEIQDAYEDRDRWNSMSIRNIAMAARFAADRSIRDYAREIWHTKPISE